MIEESLPITINASQRLLSRYRKLDGVTNKQEAQVNFQTLAAGWYEDESNITTIEIYLVCDDEYQEQLTIESIGSKTEVADDVVIYTQSNQVNCFIAITEAEAIILDKEPKILSGYLTIKIKKVINEIALKRGLLELP